MSNTADALRRWLGMFCLAMASGMLIWGHTILRPHLQGIPFAIYWGVCLVFTIASIVIALLDVRAMLRNIRMQRALLAKRAMRVVDPAGHLEHGLPEQERSERAGRRES